MALSRGQSCARRWAFSVAFPLRVSLQKELGLLLVSFGMIGSALATFERLELWDSLIACHMLLKKNVLAEELVRRRLEVCSSLQPKGSLASLVWGDDEGAGGWKCRFGALFEDLGVAEFKE